MEHLFSRTKWAVMDVQQGALRVLVVDDDEATRSIVATWMHRYGYVCRTAPDGLAALMLLDREPTDIVILDWQMPGMDGIELARILRARPNLVSPYLVMMTGDPERTAIQNAFAAGVDDFIRKPIDSVELLARLHAANRVLELEKRIREKVQNEAMIGVHRGSVRELSEVVATLAHDLRTPLATLRMTSEGLRSRAMMEAKELLPMVNRMCRVSASMADTLEDVVSAFLVHEAREIPWTEFDAKDEIQKSLEMISASLPASTRVEIPDTPIRLTGNPYSFRRLIMNLVSNSLRHGACGSIKIACREYEADPNQMVLEIQDDGRGIAADLLPHLGEPMFLSSAARRQEFFVNGTGLGLYICRKIVAEFGGRLIVSSGESRGTVVRAYLYRKLVEPSMDRDVAPLESEVLP